MTIKQTLLKQFDDCYDQDGWFVALKNALDGVTAEQAAWKPGGTDNSIWESLSHLNYYNNAYLERFKGIDYKYRISDNKETFTSGGSHEEWQADVGRFDAIMSEWRELLSASDDAKLNSAVSAENATEWKFIIADINTHNAYHGGQILLLRKLQGAWNPEKGVS